MHKLIREIAAEQNVPKKVVDAFAHLAHRKDLPLGPTTFFYDRLCRPFKHPLKTHLAYRRLLLSLGYASEEWAHDLWTICARDILFFCNSFGFLLEPRDEKDDGTETKHKVIPFLTYPFQDQCITLTQQKLGRSDVLYDKSRATGATWMGLYLADHRWRFIPHSHIGLVSRHEMAVDNPNDPDSLMTKLDFIGEHLPAWLKPRASRCTSLHSWRNHDNKSTITGYPATGNMMRGGRKTWVLMDELHAFRHPDDEAAMESTQLVTRSRLFISTVSRQRGPTGVYYRLARGSADRDITRIVLDWKGHPEQGMGLYRVDRGVVTILDHAYWDKFKRPDGSYADPNHPAKNYEFQVNAAVGGNIRSPYYDRQCKRPGATSQSIAAELDRSLDAATAQFFDPDILAKARAEIRAPSLRGMLLEDEGDDYKWQPVEHGLWHLWCPLDPYGSPPSDTDYVVGADVCWGTGGEQSSNSALVILNRHTGEQVARYSNHRISPVPFAHLAVAACRWFEGVSGNPALLVVEVPGPGVQLLKEARRIGFTRLYLRSDTEHLGKKKTDKPGYHNRDGGITLLGELQRAIGTGETVPHDDMLLTECGQYRFKGGKLIHASITTTLDDGAKMQGHGDVAIAYACAWHGIIDAGSTKPKRSRRTIAPIDEELLPVPPPGKRDWRIMAHRMADAFDEDARRDDDPYDW